MGGLYVLGLKERFDKVPHNRLLWKLENIGGLNGKKKSWMKSYLTGKENSYRHGPCGEQQDGQDNHGARRASRAPSSVR